MAINARFNEGSSSPSGGDGQTYQISTPGIGPFGSDPMAAGDIIVLLAEGGSAGGGLTVPAITDNLGSTGWVKLADSASYAPDFRVTVWWKLCVGGETFVHGDWGSTGTGRGLVAIFVRSPGTLNEAYLIGAGGASFHGGGSLTFGPVNPTGNGEMYVGGTGIGPNNYSGATIDSPPGTHDNNGVTGNGFNNGATDKVSGIIHINDNVGANLATDNLSYTTSPLNSTWSFFVGIRTGATPPVHPAGSAGLVLGATAALSLEARLAGSAGLALGATAALSVAEGGAIEGSAGLLVGASVPLDVTGGDVFLGAEAGIVVGATVPLSAPSPFPPVPPVRPLRGVLGCGLYDVFIFDRGLATIVGRIPFNTLQWERVLDDTSTAQVTINGVSNVGAMQRCCQLLGAVTPWEHEIGIYRDGARVWSGPVMDVTFPSETVVIDAADLSAWLAVRWLHDNHNDVATDLANIWVGYVDDAMSVENSAGLFPIVQALTGVLADRLYTPDMGTFAADAIAELARTGLDWSCVDRRLVGGPVAVQPAAYPDAPVIPTLIDESFRDAPTVSRSGSLMGNAIFVGGSGNGPGGNAIFGQYGPHFPASADHVETPAAPDYAAIEALYGRIERRVNETKILDQASIDQNAATRYDLLKTPVNVISEGTLLPTAGIDISQLTPGSIQNMHLTRACVQIGEPYRLKKLTVTAQSDGAEDVVGAWEPVGSVAAHEDL